MTKRMIEKKLEKANISTHFLTIEKDYVEIYVPDTDCHDMSQVQELLINKVTETINFSGHSFNTAYGAWIMKNTPEPRYNR